MLSIIAASLLVLSADALLFPISDGKNPEPELLAICPMPSQAVAHGSGSCKYGLFELTCTLNCDDGYQNSIDGMKSLVVTCDIFDGFSISGPPSCNLIGGTVPGTGVTTGGNTGMLTNAPVHHMGCVATLDDCLNRLPGDYQFCNDCQRFATCASSGFYVRACPGLAFFDADMDRCQEHSNTCA